MKKIEKKGFVLAASGNAQQVVLFTHGGWVEQDGLTTIPGTLTVCFYAGHGHFTVGATVYNNIIRLGATARGGVVKAIEVSDQDLDAFGKSKGRDAAWARSEFEKYAFGTYDSFGGGNPMFNYSLSREPKGMRLDTEKKLFANHMAGKGHYDVDLLMMTTTDDRHLSDVFKFIEGRGYTTLHFGACRVPYGASPSEVSH